MPVRAIDFKRCGRLAAAVAFVLGLAWAAWLYGTRVVDPASFQWLLHGDPAQHHIGSVFFRAEPWHWPPGLMTGFGESPTSVVFTDSIPLVAILIKLLGVAPQHQYFGLWMLACHALQGWYAVRLLQAFGVQRAECLIGGAAFFITAPALLLRAYGHEALMAHFIVLAALSLCIAPAGNPGSRSSTPGSWPWKTWIMWAVVALGVHAYLVVMVAVLGVSAAYQAMRSQAVRWSALCRQGMVAATALCAAAWLFGYAVGAAQRSADGFGFYSANLLSWLDPMDWSAFNHLHGREVPYAGEWSTLLPAQVQATAGQYEGFAYLGAGMLFIVAACCLLVGWRAAVLPGLGARPATAVPRAYPSATWIAATVLALAALSNRITFGGHTLFQWPMSETVATWAGVFRASGRLIWPLTYLVMASAIAVVARRALNVPSRWLAALVLPAGLALQAADGWDKWAEFRERFRGGPPGVERPLTHPWWATALAACPRMQMVSLRPELQSWEAPALAAALSGASFSPAPTARAVPSSEAQLRQAAQALADGNWRGDTLYLLDPSVQPLLSGQPLPGGMHATWLESRLVVAAKRCGSPAPR